VTDRILLAGILAEGRHGVHEHERLVPQVFEIDVELALDLRPAGESDDLARTVDYSRVDAEVRALVATTSFRLIEALAETIAAAILAAHPADEVVVRVRKPAVLLGGPLESVGVEIRRRRPDGRPAPES
jgi:dihydroneopterin aldolase